MRLLTSLQYPSVRVVVCYFALATPLPVLKDKRGMLAWRVPPLGRHRAPAILTIQVMRPCKHEGTHARSNEAPTPPSVGVVV